RGRCSCTISERPTSSPFASSSLLLSLTPLFPLHARHSPVSPIIPALTQNIGGGGIPNAAFASSPSFTSSSSALARTRRRGTKGTLSAAPRATAAQRVVRPPMCTTESSGIVGAPTFLSLHTIGRSQKRPASERSPCTNFEPVSSFSSDLLLATSHSSLATKSNHSRTSRKFARKSNYSRTYAKTGGWGVSLNFQLLTLNRFFPLSPTIPAHTRGSPVSPIIPALTQNIGGGGRVS